MLFVVVLNCWKREKCTKPRDKFEMRKAFFSCLTENARRNHRRILCWNGIGNRSHDSADESGEFVKTCFYYSRIFYWIEVRGGILTGKLKQIKTKPRRKWNSGQIPWKFIQERVKITRIKVNFWDFHEIYQTVCEITFLQSKEMLTYVALRRQRWILSSTSFVVNAIWIL